MRPFLHSPLTDSPQEKHDLQFIHFLCDSQRSEVLSCCSTFQLKRKCFAIILKNIFTDQRNSGWQIFSSNILKKPLLSSDFHVFDKESLVTVTFVSRWLMCHSFSSLFFFFFQIVLFFISRSCTVMCFDVASVWLLDLIFQHHLISWLGVFRGYGNS